MRYLALLLLLAAFALAAPPKPVAEPDLPDGTAKAAKQMAGFRIPAGLKVELYAAEPKLGSPVAIGIDEKNRVYVAEEYRFSAGTEENRTRSFLLEDDLQLKTVADRLAMYKKHAAKFDGGMDWFSKHADQVRLLEDTTGSGRADKSTVFAGGFNDPLDGLAAGVLAHNGEVYFTNIPNLWKLKDTDGDGVADKREALLTGFGVNCAFLGHDLHGLAFGPDGKLYFSVGDRGFNVTSKEGKTFSGPRTGAVFRCNPDGTDFEVVHRGLRNPQELAFDQYGNLFADDNNCDKGDHARLVYVVEGGESGWNMAYQTIPAPYMSGPWFAERLWHLEHAGQPAYILPSVAALGSGPSGFTFTSGTSLGERYKNSFLMCNYTGNGGLESFKVKPKGATFEMVDSHDFLKPIKATDCEFGYDGKLYVSDFVDLDWTGKSMGGRIYTVFDPKKMTDPVVEETKALFAEGFDKRKTPELLKLLGHADQRVRLRAQFTLAGRGGKDVIDGLTTAVQFAPDATIRRIHAVWCLGQIARTDRNALTAVIPLTVDSDLEVMGQVAKVLGDARTSGAGTRLIQAIKHADARGKFFIAQSLGKLEHKPAIEPLFDLLKANADKDTYLRHACIIALTRIGDADAVNAKAIDPSASVRMAVVLVQRRLQDKRLVQFLTDADPLVRVEAARAIHDLPLTDAYPALAAILPSLGQSPGQDDALVRRAISANFRLGGANHAKAVVGVVTNSNFSVAARGEALGALRDWADPPQRDRVTGFWNPLGKRDPKIVRGVLEPAIPDLLAKTTGQLQTDAVSLIAKVGVKADEATFVAWSADKTKGPNTRVAAIRYLAERKSKSLDAVLAAGLKDESPLVRAEVRDVLVRTNAVGNVPKLVAVLDDSSATTFERQRALASLGWVKGPVAGPVLDEWAANLAAGKVPAELRLDVLDALKANPGPTRDKFRAAFDAAEPKDPVGKFRNALLGGDAERGRDIFFGHTAAQCVRCHKVQGSGGDAGPDLTEVVKRNPEKTREHLLESIAQPSAKLAVGYAAVTLDLVDGRVIGGVITAEDKLNVTVKTPEGKTITIPVADIEKRTVQPSSMPAMDRTLSPREVRDLIEYLSTMK